MATSFNEFWLNYILGTINWTFCPISSSHYPRPRRRWPGQNILSIFEVPPSGCSFSCSSFIFLISYYNKWLSAKNKKKSYSSFTSYCSLIPKWFLQASSLIFGCLILLTFLFHKYGLCGRSEAHPAPLCYNLGVQVLGGPKNYLTFEVLLIHKYLDF